MTLEEITKILAYAAAAYDRVVTEDMVCVYMDQLGKLDCQPVVDAIRHHVSTSDRFPTVADIRSAMATLARRRPDPTVAANNLIAEKVYDARKAGATPDEVAELIDSLERSLSVRKQ